MADIRILSIKPMHAWVAEAEVGQDAYIAHMPHLKLRTMMEGTMNEWFSQGLDQKADGP